MTFFARFSKTQDTHATVNMDLHKSNAKEIVACLDYARICPYVLFQLQSDLGRAELYAETVELHKQWLKHLLTAAAPDEALLVANAEAGCSHAVETASANKLAESQAGDEVMAKAWRVQFSMLAQPFIHCKCIQMCNSICFKSKLLPMITSCVCLHGATITLCQQRHQHNASLQKVLQAAEVSAASTYLCSKQD